MIYSKGSVSEILNEKQITEICTDAFASQNLTGKKILAIIPDNSRTAPVDIMFRVITDLLAERVKRLDFLVALGTHPPLSDDAINKRVGITSRQRKEKYTGVRFFNHNWQDKNQLTKIGVISEEETEKLSGGLMRQKVDVTINKMVFEYDLLMIIGPTFPHEVVGFSGGNKYLFPGISGQEIIDMFHWLGALITNPVIIGTKYTPVRAVVDRAAAMVAVEKICLSLVVKDDDLAGLFIGSPEETWAAAADLSAQLHVIYKNKPFRRVLSCSPPMYDDLWTGGKCVYKLEPVVADGGELIIYAPHIKEVSVAHGKIIEKIGYHVRDYFVRQMVRFRDIPGGIMAHSTHVKGIGTYENGVESARINVILATQISRTVCKKINLGYMDPHSISISDWQNREDEEILHVPKAGEILYRLENDPFRK